MVNEKTHDTILHGHRLFIARTVWVVLVMLILLLWAAGTLALIREPLPDCIQVVCDPIDLTTRDLQMARELGLPTSFLGDAFTAIVAMITGILYFTIAGIIFCRKSNDWLGLLVSFTLVYLGGLFFTSSDDALIRTYPGFQLLADILFIPGFVSLFVLFLVFPDGQLIPRWSAWMAAPLLSGAILFEIFLPAGDLPETLESIIFVSLFVLSAGAQCYRYFWISSPEARQQTKWVVLGLAGSLALMMAWLVVATFYPPDQPGASRIFALLISVPVIAFFGSLLPLSFAFSILRYRLWDIDVLINRGLVYGTLTAALALVYLISVAILQSVFVALTGQGSQIAIVLSTLVMAALFRPLHGRVQRLIDRRFYRRRYDAIKTLGDFAQIARDEVDINKLGLALLAAVEETMEPDHVSLWLREPEVAPIPPATVESSNLTT